MKPVKTEVSSHAITNDDSNKEVWGSAIFIHNQGTNVVKVKNHILLPDDTLRYEVEPGESEVRLRLPIKFLAVFTFQRAIVFYPQLYVGNRLLIEEIRKVY